MRRDSVLMAALVKQGAPRLLDRLPGRTPEEKGDTEKAQKRRRVSADLKKKAALEALREQDTVQKIASRHKVYPSQVSAWKRQAVEELSRVLEVGGTHGFGEMSRTERQSALGVNRVRRMMRLMGLTAA